MPSSIAEELAEKTFRELEQLQKPQQRSRISNSTNGYIHLVGWANACLLRVFCRLLAEALPDSEKRTRPHLKDSGRSVIANIEEGHRRPTTIEYITFIGYSQGSLEEIKGDVRRLREDGLLKMVPGSSLAGLGIDLKGWHEALKKTTISKPVESKGIYRSLEESRGREKSRELVSGSITSYASPEYSKGVYRSLEDSKGKEIGLETPLKSSIFLYGYPPVDEVTARDLTYEVLIELINKTDWHLRRLVESLEDKLNREQQFYKVEQARIRGKLSPVK